MEYFLQRHSRGRGLHRLHSKQKRQKSEKEKNSNAYYHISYHFLLRFYFPPYLSSSLYHLCCSILFLRSVNSHIGPTERNHFHYEKQSGSSNSFSDVRLKRSNEVFSCFVLADAVTRFSSLLLTVYYISHAWISSNCVSLICLSENDKIRNLHHLKCIGTYRWQF